MYSGPRNTRNVLVVSELGAKFVEVSNKLSIQLEDIWLITFFQNIILIPLVWEGDVILLLFIMNMRGM